MHNLQKQGNNANTYKLTCDSACRTRLGLLRGFLWLPESSSLCCYTVQVVCMMAGVNTKLGSLAWHFKRRLHDPGNEIERDRLLAACMALDGCLYGFHRLLSSRCDFHRRKRKQLFVAYRLLVMSGLPVDTWVCLLLALGMRQTER
jgi:hypothetical protein